LRACCFDETSLSRASRLFFNSLLAAARRGPRNEPWRPIGALTIEPLPAVEREPR
jgi:hypothetical protein